MFVDRRVQHNQWMWDTQLLRRLARLSDYFGGTCYWLPRGVLRVVATEMEEGVGFSAIWCGVWGK